MKEAPHNPYSGELLPFERQYLFNVILELNPKICLEVGAGSGCGSTFFILEALKLLNNKGRLYTCDLGNTIIPEIATGYTNILNFNPDGSSALIQFLINENLIPDFIFFDGPENPELALNDIQILESHIKPNTVFMMHDWEINTRLYDLYVCKKATLIHQYIHNNNKWKLINEFTGTEKFVYENQECLSVGLVHAIFQP